MKLLKFKPKKSKKKSPVDQMVHALKVMESVKELEKLEALKVGSGEVYLFIELWQSKEGAKHWIRNMYLHCVLQNKMKEGDVLYFKNIETGEVIGYYKGNEPVVLIEV